MSFIPCRQHDDPFTLRVRQTYGANVVSAPRAGIDPLDTLAVQGRHVEPRGRLAGLIRGEPPELPVVTEAPVADLSEVTSTAVSVSLGLSLSATFLAAMGVPIPGGGIDATLWDGASTFSFQVREVVDRQVDVGVLGQALKGRKVDHTPATDVFFREPKANLYVITRTLTSPSFVLRAVGDKGQAVAVSVDGLADVLGEAHVGVHWRKERDEAVVFRGPVPVTFGFGAVPCALDADGALWFGLSTNDLTLGVADADTAPVARPVVDAAGLLSLDAPAGVP